MKIIFDAASLFVLLTAMGGLGYLLGFCRAWYIFDRPRGPRH